MKRILVIMFTLSIMSCTSIQLPKIKQLEKREVVTNYKPDENDKQIVNIISYIFQDKYSQRLVLEKNISKMIDTHKIIFNEKSWIYLDEYETYDKNINDLINIFNSKKNKIELSQSTIENFKEKNKKEYIFDFNSIKNDIMLSYIAIENKISNEPYQHWQDIYNIYPDASGVLSISGIGYNVEKNQALVVISFSYASSHGAGRSDLVLLEKSNLNTWLIKGNVSTRKFY